MKVLGLIPTRIGSTRLPSKPLLEINGIPLVIHTYKRASLSKLINKIMICTDSKKITTVAKKFKAKSILTSQHHKNGTERITEAYVKEGKNYDLVLDIQGDEPLISPYHIDEIIKFHAQNKDADIILPTLKVVLPDNPNVVKVVSNKKNEVLYLSRAKIPYESKLKSRYFLKHLSIISFKPEALIKFPEQIFLPDFRLMDSRTLFFLFRPTTSSFKNFTPKSSAFLLNPSTKATLSNQPSPDLP